MDDLFDVLSPSRSSLSRSSAAGSRPVTGTIPFDTPAEKLSLAASLRHHSDDEASDGDDAREDESADEFDADRNVLTTSKGLSVVVVGGGSSSSSASSSLVASAAGTTARRVETTTPTPTPTATRSPPKTNRRTSSVPLHDDSAFPLHNALQTPRKAPTPYDPPGYVPALDMDGLLSAYRRIREALKVERINHKITKDETMIMNRKVAVCKNLSATRLKKLASVRDKQDGYMASWKEIEIRHKKQKAMWDKDITSLVLDQRQLKKALEYEQSQIASEVKKIDNYDDLIVKMDDELRKLVGDIGLRSSENDLIHRAAKSLNLAFESTKVVSDESELLVEEVHSKLADLELDTVMLQRQVKVAEDDVKAWKNRYAFVERDVLRAEKLLADGAEQYRGGESKKARRFISGQEDDYTLGISGGGGGGKTDTGFEGGRTKRTEKAIESTMVKRDPPHPFKVPAASTSASGPLERTKSLSSIARSFNGVDDLIGGRSPLAASAAQAPPTALMAAVLMPSSGNVYSDFDYFTADDDSQQHLRTASPDDFVYANDLYNNKSGGFKAAAKPSLLPRINKDTTTTAREKMRTGEFVDGMKIEFHDSYDAIVAKNNRRGTAKDRSVSLNSELWPINPSQWPDA